MNNIVYDNQAANSPQCAGNFNLTYTCCSQALPGMGNIVDDPMFVDQVNGDFHLQPVSPCIDAGDPQSSLDPDSTRADMGALYYPQVLAVKKDNKVQPSRLELLPAHPNPFNSTTVISFQLPVANWVKLEIFDINGGPVGAHGHAPLVYGWRQSGVHQVTFDAPYLPSGVYVARLQANGVQQIQKLLLIK